MGSAAPIPDKITGFGGVAHANHVQFIDFAGVSVFANRHQLHLRCLAHQRDADRHRWCAFGERHPSGQVRHLEFRKVNDGSGHLEIIDPTTVFTGPLVISGGSSLVASNGDIGAGAATTLGYSANGSGTGGTLAVSDGTRAATIALLGNYIAGSLRHRGRRPRRHPRYGCANGKRAAADHAAPVT